MLAVALWSQARRYSTRDDCAIFQKQNRQLFVWNLKQRGPRNQTLGGETRAIFAAEVRLRVCKKRGALVSVQNKANIPLEL